MGNAPRRSFGLFILFSLILTSGLLSNIPAFALERTFTNSLGMEFVLIPAGTFTMGSPSNEPNRNRDEVLHKVTISKPFYMQTTEVTLKQWRSLMGTRLFGEQKGPDNEPVVKVSWHDCMDFIAKLNALKEGTYSLPTESQWEYACRAGSTTPYSWGNDIDCSKAMYSNNTQKAKKCVDYVKSRGVAPDGPAPVKTYPPNAWGLYDMHGNVWEWCEDQYGPYPKGGAVDPRGPSSGTAKVRRGGSWFKYGYFCRSANRNYGHPMSRYQTTGFRLVRQVE
ncbi:MAG: formylglycine-generating enzyme family protein [Pseudomonadota bacterium]